jgi:hypothetical protein
MQKGKKQICVQKTKHHGSSPMSKAWKILRVLVRGKFLTENSSEKRKTEVEKASLLDWLLAIDASIT